MIHEPGCDCGAYACSLRSKGVQVSPAGMVRHNKKTPAPQRYNGWEKGTAGEDRPNGTRMPYLDKHGSDIPIKKFAQGDFAKDQKALSEARARNTVR